MPNRGPALRAAQVAARFVGQIAGQIAGLLCLSLLLSACAPQPVGGEIEPSLVTISNERDATVTAVRSSAALVLEIRSDGGIGSADIALAPNANVRDIILRLSLSGLENLTFAAADGHLVTLSVSSSDGIVRQTLRAPGATAQTELRRGDDWWMDVGLISNDPAVAATIPLINGHFDVAVPRAFLAATPRAFSLSWVDFYR